MFSQETLKVIRNLQVVTTNFYLLNRKRHSTRESIVLMLSILICFWVSFHSLFSNRFTGVSLLSLYSVPLSIACPLILSNMHVFRWGIRTLNPYYWIDKAIERGSVYLYKTLNFSSDFHKLTFYEFFDLIKLVGDASNLTEDEQFPDHPEFQFLFDLETPEGQTYFVQHLEKKPLLLETLIKLGADLKDFPSVEDKFAQKICFSGRLSLQWMAATFINEHNLYLEPLEEKKINLTEPAIDILQANSQLYLKRYSLRSKCAENEAQGEETPNPKRIKTAV